MTDMVSENRFTWKDINISGFTLTSITSTNRQIGLLERTLFLQTGLPEQILLALTDFIG